MKHPRITGYGAQKKKKKKSRDESCRVEMAIAGYRIIQQSRSVLALSRMDLAIGL